MPNPSPIRTIAFVSLGCPKNLVDSERMLGLLAADGLAITPNPADADAIVINTCGFLEAAKDESLTAIRDAVGLKAKGRCKRVIVAGCLVQRHKTKLLSEVPQIDRLVGVFDREHIVDAVRGKSNPHQQGGHWLGKYHGLNRKGVGPGVSGVGGEGNSQFAIRNSQPPSPQTPLPLFEDDRARLRLTPRHYAYLRISEGCNQGCSFCTIPGIRGPMRSKPIDQILAEAKELAADGAVELNLIGQDTTSYGEDIGYAAGLSGLLRVLDRELRDVHWLRLMYAYPSCFTDEMIHTIAQCQRVVKYIDIPLQHISDPILTRMRRRVTRAQIEALLAKLRKWIPGIAIRTTFIAGTPGETEQQHRELVQFVKDFGFDMMGVFPYSAEPGTSMGRMEGQWPDDIKQARVEELMLAQQQVAFARAKAMVGTTLEALVDDHRDGLFVARTQAQAPEIDSVTYLKAKGLHSGQLVQAKITDYQNYDLVAEAPARKGRGLKVIA